MNFLSSKIFSTGALKKSEPVEEIQYSEANIISSYTRALNLLTEAQTLLIRECTVMEIKYNNGTPMSMICESSGSVIKTVWGKIKAFFGAVWDWITSFIAKIRANGKAAKEAIRGIKEELTKIKNYTFKEDAKVTIKDYKINNLLDVATKLLSVSSYVDACGIGTIASGFASLIESMKQGANNGMLKEAQTLEKLVADEMAKLGGNVTDGVNLFLGQITGEKIEDNLKSTIQEKYMDPEQKTVKGKDISGLAADILRWFESVDEEKMATTMDEGKSKFQKISKEWTSAAENFESMEFTAEDEAGNNILNETKTILLKLSQDILNIMTILNMSMGTGFTVGQFAYKTAISESQNVVKEIKKAAEQAASFDN